MSVTRSVIQGFALGASLIIAIGAQNAYVLRQGLRREHVGLLVAFCAASDAALIVAGVAGIGQLITRAPWLTETIRWGGVVFLTLYGLLALRRALRPTGLDTSGGSPTRRGRALATMAALTWLNPHVYLDTLLLVGSLANSHGGGRWWFALGAVIASIAWFTTLGYGARRLAGYFSRPAAWRTLDVAIAAVMLSIAATLAASDM